MDAEKVAEALVDIYSRLRIPEEVLSDQGPQFISDCMKAVCKLLGVSQSTTAPYHPMCNGLVEKVQWHIKEDAEETPYTAHVLELSYCATHTSWKPPRLLAHIAICPVTLTTQHRSQCAKMVQKWARLLCLILRNDFRVGWSWSIDRWPCILLCPASTLFWWLFSIFYLDIFSLATFDPIVPVDLVVGWSRSRCRLL